MNAIDMFRLDGARALVTGASRGIGKAVAEGLADAGCDLAVTARTLPALDATLRAVEERGHKAVALDGDLTEPGAAADLVDRAAAALGGLDVVVHNAGTLPTAEDGSPLLAPLQHARQQDWETVVTVNLNATAALCRAAHPHLADSRRASLILMSSVAGLVGTPMMEAYAATKAAQLSLTRSLAVGWARQGIRVNALCPGWTRTDMTAFASETGPLSDWLTSHVPMGRWATADEVVGAALFLAAPASSFVTGHALVVDGGLAVPDGGLAGHPKPASPFVTV
ncbi:short-chain dehydrogenase [Streptomyces viridochromogenes]|uniref:Short-chain dehydrogenase n=1 Tax=Streptomyces viridochromogenes TaxID=1938 RepID=A0A0J7ZA40_STRVR|nr:SDR family NAD(P)-dependent oxidoreductase [Streptomyces viridochromogenes]KMS72342.1 short-chain dehydrogenase [Streptomyces viridochromogenes]KOG16301.1 short-chain dehydrogenase [Streptomyces viridochromogenes]KOG16837.1 short-chain dehydrogenase [Streptomyces viridochromogenes]